MEVLQRPRPENAVEFDIGKVQLRIYTLIVKKNSWIRKCKRGPP